MTALTHNYNGFDISQESDGYTSLTDMAKAAGKLVADYLKNDSTQAYFQGLSDDMNIPISSLIRIVQGKGKAQGTWAHPEVAIDFAKWCNVSFRIWANRTLRGVIEGKVSQPRTDNTLAIRKIDLQIDIKRLELQKLELQREDIAPRTVSAPIQTELPIDIVQRYNDSKAALLAAQTIENEHKAKRIESKFALKTDANTTLLDKILNKARQSAQPLAMRDLYRNFAGIRNLAKEQKVSPSDVTLALCQELVESQKGELIKTEKGSYLFKCYPILRVC